MPAPGPTEGNLDPKAAVPAGLPPIAPDVVEQEEGDEIDNVVPGRGLRAIPTVGLGGSAGSLGALQEFFGRMPADSGMAFVVVLHLSSEHESVLAEMLGRTTKMPVVQAEDRQKLEPNSVYVIPPGSFLALTKGELRLTEFVPERGKRMTVDLFFRTLADTNGARAAAVILSGADGDGALGIKRIKERGGLTIAQDPDEAEHPSMPRTAIDTGMVDWVLPVAEMPQRLMAYRSNEARLKLPSEDGPQPVLAAPSISDEDEKALRDTLLHLRSCTGRDFAYYKRATVVRRISRRMQVSGLDTLPAYLDFLRTNSAEALLLQQDLLISVTNFFRDRDAFAALETQVAEIFAGKGAGDAVRVWVAACATGEEAYSIGMLLLEHAAICDNPPTVQVFATDLDEEAITAARAGLYPEAITADVSDDRLRRFFAKEHRGYRVRRELRESVLFAVHDVLKDAPFSRLDLVSCRNLLIYLTREAQERALQLFHFSLRPEGRLFLGSSEAVDEDSPLFTVVDKKHRIYRQRPMLRVGVPVPIGPSTLSRAMEAQQRARFGPYVHGPGFATATATLEGETEAEAARQRVSWEELHFKLIERFSPPSLIVTREYDIVHMSENAGRFLHFSGGSPSVNLLHVVHPMLRVELRAALFRAAQNSVPVEVFRVPLELDGTAMTVDIRVAPAQEIAPDYLLVVLSPRESAGDAGKVRVEAEPAVRHLESEIEQMKRRLRETVEQYEASTEELKASNEELQAMNEELRSATEELETSREELQSINEELSTVNAELKSKVDELGHANSDLFNLMAATGVATIFLDRRFRIMRYTPSAVDLFRLIPSDLGRPLTDLAQHLNYSELTADAGRVLETLLPVRRELSDDDGHWFLAQLLPYRTSDDHIAGVVLTFVDITARKQTEEELLKSREELDAALALAQVGIWRFETVTGDSVLNDMALRQYGFTAGSRLTFDDFMAVVHPDDRAAFSAAVERSRAEGVSFEVEHRIIRGSDRQERWIFSKGGLAQESAPHSVIGASIDITERRRTEETQRWLASVVESSNDAIISFSFDGRIVSWNPGAERIFGYSRDEIVGRPRSILAAADATEDQALFERLCGGETVEQVETLRLKKSGEAFPASVTSSPIRGAQGQVIGVTSIVQDITERRRAEEALRASEERLRRAFEIETVGIIYFTVDGRITGSNDAFLRMSGYDRADLESGTLRWDEMTPPEWLPQSHEAIKQLAVFGRTVPYEKEYVRKDGTRWWALFAASRLDDVEGVEFIIDITDRKWAEEALREAEERSRAIISQANVGIAYADITGRITFINERLAQLLGRTPAEVIGRPLEEVIFPDGQVEEARQQFQRTIAEGAAFQTENRLAAAGGLSVWVNVTVSPIRDAAGDLRSVVAAVLDMTENKAAQEALRISNERLRLVVENAREYAIFSTDLERRVTTWNSGAEAILGFTEAEILGHAADVIFIPEDLAANAPAAEAQRALDEGRAMDERWHVRKDGSRFWANGVMMAMHDATGEAIGFVKILRDESEAREVREALEQSRQQLWTALQETETARAQAEAAGEAKDHFLAVLSHELRTPLTPVAMAVHSLLRRDDLPPPVMQAIDMIGRNVQLEAHLVDDLLDLTRITRGKLEIVRERLDLHQVVTRALEVSRPDMTAKRQRVQVSLDATEHELTGDATRLQQVFWNLLKNASKFTPDEGEIRITSRTESGRVVVAISDTGIGIEGEALARIFDAFVQANRAITREFGGLGLGLAISKATIDAHGGNLRAESAGRDRGATFIVELPLS